MKNKSNGIYEPHPDMARFLLLDSVETNNQLEKGNLRYTTTVPQSANNNINNEKTLGKALIDAKQNREK